MTTLAQEILEQEHHPIFKDRDATMLADRFIRMAQAALTIPWEPNHLQLPHKAIADLYVEDARAHAQRYVARESVYLAASRLLKKDRDLDAITQWGRPPSDPCWLEVIVPSLKTNAGLGNRIGYLFDTKTREGKPGFRAIVFIKPFFPQLRGWRVVPVLLWDQVYGEALPTMQWIGPPDRDAADDDVVRLVRPGMVVLALINTPHAVDRRVCIADEKLQNARRKKGRLPLLSYNELRFFVPRTDADFGTDERIEVGKGVAWHRVDGYWREVTRGSKRYVHVDPYERGDRRLGIILKVKNIDAKPRREPEPSP